MTKESLSEVEQLARRLELGRDPWMHGKEAAAKLRELERDYWELDADFLQMEAAIKKLGAERDEARALADKMAEILNNDPDFIVPVRTGPWTTHEWKIKRMEMLEIWKQRSWRSKEESA